MKAIHQTQIGDQLEGADDGIEILLKFLKGIYKTDDFADAFEVYIKFEEIERKSSETMNDFITRWDNIVAKLKKQECTMADKILAFKLLKSSNLTENDRKHVM